MREKYCESRDLSNEFVKIGRQQQHNVTTGYEMRLYIFRNRFVVRRWRAIQEELISKAEALGLISQGRVLNETAAAWFNPFLNKQVFRTLPLQPEVFATFIAFLVSAGVVVVGALVTGVFIFKERKVAEFFWWALIAGVLVTSSIAVAWASLWLQVHLIASSTEVVLQFLSYMLYLSNTLVIVIFAYFLVAAVFSTVSGRELPSWVAVATVCVMGVLTSYTLAMQIVHSVSTQYVYDASELLLESVSVVVTLGLVVAFAIALRVTTKRKTKNIRLTQLLFGCALLVFVLHCAQLALTIVLEFTPPHRLDVLFLALTLCSFMATSVAAIAYVWLSLSKGWRPMTQYAPLTDHDAQEPAQVPRRYEL